MRIVKLFSNIASKCSPATKYIQFDEGCLLNIFDTNIPCCNDSIFCITEQFLFIVHQEITYFIVFFLVNTQWF